MWIALVAMASCAPCHEAIVRTFAATGMARSVSAPAAAELRHKAGGEERVARWAVGSGNEGKSFLIGVGDALFQSPMAWYSRLKKWDLSPGYTKETADFSRPVTADCLFCHAGVSRPVAGTLNRYQGSLSPIGCERCHGSGEAHAREAKRGNIVNPARLGARARDSVCEQCHLQGAARVPAPGKKFGDFRPGMALEEVFSVYLPASAEGFKVVSHVEQLALSKCSVESGGKLWCGSCHDAHGGKRAGCEQCHAQTRPHGEACADCHMPRTAARDGGHTAFTDHRIRKPGGVLNGAVATGLRAWREPAEGLRARGLGLAYAGAGEFSKAYGLLRGVEEDGETQAALGLIYLRAGKTAEGVAVLERAVRAEPGSSVRRLNLAAGLLAAGERGRAAAEAKRAMEIEPLLRDAYVLMAEIEPGRAGYWKGEFERRWGRGR